MILPHATNRKHTIACHIDSLVQDSGKFSASGLGEAIIA